MRRIRAILPHVVATADCRVTLCEEAKSFPSLQSCWTAAEKTGEGQHLRRRRAMLPHMVATADCRGTSCKDAKAFPFSHSELQ